MDFIEIGKSVNIKRTDGRIHTAMVSKINIPSRSVTVEWYERGETKGKEVELDHIIQLNAELMQEQQAASMPKIIKQTEYPLSREPSHSSIEDDSFYEDDAAIEHAAVTGGIGGGGGDVGCEEDIIDIGNSCQPASGTLPIKQILSRSNPTHGNLRVNKVNQSTCIPTNSTNGNRTTRSSVSSTQNGINDPNNIPSAPLVLKTRTQNSGMPTNTHQQSQQQHVLQQQQQQQPQPQQQLQPPQPLQHQQVALIAQNAAGRRSYVVKEVEKLKENREKRRARQAEIKEEKNALMNMDPGNPNWELAAMIREFTSQIEFRPLVDGLPIEDHQITVCVRKRPVSRKELMRKELDVISVPTKDQLIVHEPKTKVDLTKFLENHKFRFDYAFDDNCNNEIVYKYTAKPLVKTIFEGGMATCFAYGQTGAGKTHTMGGQFNGKQQDCKNGIYAMAAKDVFSLLHGQKYKHLKLVVSCSFFEIYSGKVFDLLSDKQKLRVLEDGKQQVQVVGLTEKVVDNVEEVLKIIQHGNSTRTSGQTSANSNSSRSHAVFQIVLRPPGSSRIHGKFSFIDLAGNERGADTSSSNRQTRMEGAEINKSLLALKECIRALGKQSAHLPFRVSKLTQVLRDSFIGEKSKTCMIAMISPGLSSCEHTLNTLRYANRVKELVVQDVGECRNYDDDDIMEHNSDEHNNGNDLAHLRSLNEHEMSDAVYNQHALISDLQQTEEVLVDHHKALNEFVVQFLNESQQLHSLTNYVEYDQDSYCKRSEELFTQLAELLGTCRGLMVDFRGKLANEEMLSHNVNVAYPGSSKNL